jgi:hypothetical protein
VELITGQLSFAKEDEEEKGELISSPFLAAISIPTSQSPTEFCEFMQDYEPYVKEMRVMKTSIPKFYTIAIRCTSGKEAVIHDF